jgi:hypothetical protein
LPLPFGPTSANELGEHLLRAGLEIAAAAREERVERVGVRVRLLRLVCEASSERIHVPLGFRDTRAPRKVRAERLFRPRIALLWEIADGERRGLADSAAIRLVDAREQAQ